MNPDLPEEAVEFAAAAERSFAALGGVDLARRAEEDPTCRRGAGAALDTLGLADLEPWRGGEGAAAAAELCRVAGRVVLPYPVVGLLMRRPDDGLPFAVVTEERPRVDHGDLFAPWRVATAAGAAGVAAPAGGPLGSRLGPFVTDLVWSSPSGGAERGADRWWALTLGAFWILGVVERAAELAAAHVSGRIQFGRPIAAFQSVQFALADASVAVEGLRELARYTLWRHAAEPEAAATDALALRMHALQVAGTVLRTAQQLHGAAGVCDEYDISILCRLVQPALRLPSGLERTTAALVRSIDETGFDSLFPHGGHLTRQGAT